MNFKIVLLIKYLLKKKKKYNLIKMEILLKNMNILYKYIIKLRIYFS